MPRLDRYILIECFKTFGFASLILVLIYWVNRTVILLESIVGDGHGLRDVVEISLLSLPTMVYLVLPLSTFAAALYATNRLNNDREMAVMMAAGMSPWRIARPFLFFGVAVMCLLLALGNVLIPASRAALEVKKQALSENVLRQYLRGGQFIKPKQGVTLFIRNIARQGALHDIFIADERAGEYSTMITAPSGDLINDDDGRPALVMYEGAIQQLGAQTQNISVIRFSQLRYDLSELLGASIAKVRSDIGALGTLTLLRAGPDLAATLGVSPALLQREGHMRFAQALLAPGSAFIAYAALLIGGFSRFGLGRQMALAIGAAIVVNAANAQGISSGNVLRFGWPIVYLGPVTAMLLGLLLMLFAHWQWHGGWRARSNAFTNTAVRTGGAP